MCHSFCYDAFKGAALSLHCQGSLPAAGKRSPSGSAVGFSSVLCALDMAMCQFRFLASSRSHLGQLEKNEVWWNLDDPWMMDSTKYEDHSFLFRYFRHGGKIKGYTWWHLLSTPNEKRRNTSDIGWWMTSWMGTGALLSCKQRKCAWI